MRAGHETARHGTSDAAALGRAAAIMRNGRDIANRRDGQADSLQGPQRALATRYADSFPVGPSPFPTEGPPVVDGSVVSLLCRVRSVEAADGAARVVLARVTERIEGTGGAPLLYHRRGYATLEDEGE